MATPTATEINAQLQAACNWFQKLYADVNDGTTGIVKLEDTLFQAIEGDYTPLVIPAIRTARDSISAALSRESVRSVLDPIMLEYAKLYDFPERDGRAIVRRLYRHFDDNSISVKERNFTFGSLSAAGGNAGTGTIHYLYTDAEGFEIENQYAGTYTAECVRDRMSGTVRGREEFEFRASEANIDNLTLTGSGNVDTLTCIDGSETSALVSNPSFGINSGVGVATSVTDWTATSSISNFTVTTTTYRQSEGETTAYALQCTGSDTISQDLSTLAAAFDPDVPYFCQVAVYRKDAATGTVTLTLGGQTSTLALGSATDNAWTPLFIGMNFGGTNINDAGSDCWFKNFNAATINLSVGVASLATGTVIFDDFLLAPMRRFDGGWFAPVGGATAFRYRDKFTWTNSISSDSVIQRWVVWAYDHELMLPPNSTPSIADPS